MAARYHHQRSGSLAVAKGHFMPPKLVLTPEMKRLITPELKRKALWEAATDTWWKSAPILLLSFYATSVVYGKILTRPASALTMVQRGSLFAAVLTAAAFAATLKNKSAITYGFTELGFAMAVTWAFVSSQMRAEPVAHGLALMGATYLTSRAFLNIVDGARGNKWPRVKQSTRSCGHGKRKMPPSTQPTVEPPLGSRPNGLNNEMRSVAHGLAGERVLGRGSASAEFRIPQEPRSGLFSVRRRHLL